jgi:hypothetical protein
MYIYFPEHYCFQTLVMYVLPSKQGPTFYSHTKQVVKCFIEDVGSMEAQEKKNPINIHPKTHLFRHTASFCLGGWTGGSQKDLKKHIRG